MAERWTRESWRQKPIVQVPEYPDQGALQAVARAELAEPGTILQIDIRGRTRDAEVVSLPFYEKES